MSDISPPGDPPSPLEPPRPLSPLEQQRGSASIALSMIMFLVGLVLLLPGLCALYFAAVSITHPTSISDLWGWILTGFVIGAFGVWLIWAALRRPRS